MKVAELITELSKYPPDFVVHLDVSNCYREGDDDVIAWEGDRVVRNVEGLRRQDGYNAVAIDAMDYLSSNKRGYGEIEVGG